MAYFAELNSANIVIRVLAVDDKDTANLMIRFMKLHRRVAPKITFEKSFADAETYI